MKIKILAGIFAFLLMSCDNNEKKTQQDEPEPEFQNKGHELVYNMVEKVGGYEKLKEKKDVVYTYTYQTPDGKKDVSTEKYIFDGEFSYGAYNTHERTLPDLVGLMEQGYDGTQFWLKHDGEYLTDEALIKGVIFNRPTNFYWFAMMQKLLDEGLKYEHLGEQTVNDNEYDIVKVTFNLKEGEASDVYQLYINKETKLVDQFLFTVAYYNVIETPFLMELEYENIDGILIPTTRKYKKSNWDAVVTEDPWIKVSWRNINFNNGLSMDDFNKE